MSAAESPFRIEQVSIRNYKGIDELDLEFPQSPMEADPDVIAIGSRNGVGKSSVLECPGSFTFNGLSSGQTEIIITLFLIWLATRKAPSVVLIAEPELHLNAEWHSSLVSSLVELAPDNQYILATHSDDVMSSVVRECRIILNSLNVRDG